MTGARRRRHQNRRKTSASTSIGEPPCAAANRQPRVEPIAKAPNEPAITWSNNGCLGAVRAKRVTETGRRAGVQPKRGRQRGVLLTCQKPENCTRGHYRSDVCKTEAKKTLQTPLRKCPQRAIFSFWHVSSEPRWQPRVAEPPLSGLPRSHASPARPHLLTVIGLFVRTSGSPNSRVLSIWFHPDSSAARHNVLSICIPCTPCHDA